jgi:hypothetical protein
MLRDSSLSPRISEPSLFTSNTFTFVAMATDRYMYDSAVNDDDYVGIVRSNVPIPEGIKFFYFEIRVENEGDDGYVSIMSLKSISDEKYDRRIGIGLFPVDQKLRGMPGWCNGSYGYHGDDGSVYSFRLEGRGESYGPTFGKNDVIGCGWNSAAGTIFFTKNGKDLGTLPSLL